MHSPPFPTLLCGLEGLIMKDCNVQAPLPLASGWVWPKGDNNWELEERTWKVGYFLLSPASMFWQCLHISTTTAPAGPLPNSQLPSAGLRSMIQFPSLLLQALVWNSFPLLPVPESFNTPIGSFYPCLLWAACFCPPTPRISYVEALTHNVMIFGGGTFGR